MFSTRHGKGRLPAIALLTLSRAASVGAHRLSSSLRNYCSTNRIAFTFVSDEFNGVTRDHNGNVRPLAPRRFSSLSEAEEENGRSRIYLGIHWAFDKTEGIAQERRVTDYVFQHAFVTLRRARSRPR